MPSFWQQGFKLRRKRLKMNIFTDEAGLFRSFELYIKI
jgi:hypothetical protein